MKEQKLGTSSPLLVFVVVINVSEERMKSAV